MRFEQVFLSPRCLICVHVLCRLWK
jgi:hypothetical protein